MEVEVPVLVKVGVKLQVAVGGSGVFVDVFAGVLVLVKEFVGGTAVLVLVGVEL